MPFHIHAPKPLHGWRAFFGEIAVIVIGVLIALAAEEAVTEWNWERKVAEGEKGLAVEQSNDFYFLAENVTVAPCVEAQLTRLAARLTARESTWQPVPLITDSTIAQVVRAPWRPMNSGAWSAMVAEGTSTHLAANRQKLNIQFYTQLAIFAPGQEAAHAAIARLRVLAEPVELDNRTRVELLQEISALRETVESDALVARQLMALTKRLNHDPAVSQMDAYLKPQASGTIGYCARSALPLGNWQAELAQGMEDTADFDSNPT